MTEFTIDRRELEDLLLLYPSGYINAHTVRQFESEIRRAVDQKRFKIIVNCTGLSYIASAGLGAMMGAIEEIRENGGDLRVTDLNQTVANIFEILGFHHVYRVFASEGEAIASFRNEGGSPG